MERCTRSSFGRAPESTMAKRTGSVSTDGGFGVRRSPRSSARTTISSSGTALSTRIAMQRPGLPSQGSSSAAVHAVAASAASTTTRRIRRRRP